MRQLKRLLHDHPLSLPLDERRGSRHSEFQERKDLLLFMNHFMNHFIAQNYRSHKVLSEWPGSREEGGHGLMRETHAAIRDLAI